MARINIRRYTAAWAPTFLLTVSTCAAAGPPASIAHTPVDYAYSDAYIVAWRDSTARAHMVERVVQGDGSFVDDGHQRLITFDGPGLPLYYNDTTDCNGNPMQQSVEITQAVFRPVSGKLRSGSSEVVEIGYTTDIGGCTPGMQTPFGSPDDPGIAMHNLDMTRRASMADLVPGTQLAGPTEEPPLQGATYFLAQQVTTLGKKTITFNDTGHTYPLKTVEGWLTIDLGTVNRAYTRIYRNSKTGLENWLVADWIKGAPANVESVALLPARAGAGFGNSGKAAHVWNEGLFMNDLNTAEYYFYSDMTGLKVFQGDVPDGQPVTWKLSGGNLQIARDLGDGYYFLRTWVPVANFGKYHFVMEGEDMYDPDGNDLGVNVPTRVDWYVDEGKAVKQDGASFACGASCAGIGQVPRFTVSPP